MAFSKKARKGASSPEARRKAALTAAKTRALKKKLGLSWREKLPKDVAAVPVDALIAKPENALPGRRRKRKVTYTESVTVEGRLLVGLIIDTAMELSRRGSRVT